VRADYPLDFLVVNDSLSIPFDLMSTEHLSLLPSLLFSIHPSIAFILTDFILFFTGYIELVCSTETRYRVIGSYALRVVLLLVALIAMLVNRIYLEHIGLLEGLIRVCILSNQIIFVVGIL
jgi:hypothetical protein